MLMRQPDANKLKNWFQCRFPDRAEIQLTKMRRAFPGLSRETWFIDLSWRAEGRDQLARYVLRTQLPGNVSLAPRSLEYEAKIYEALSRTDLPMPPYYGFEARSAWLIDGERPFLVRGWVEGVLEPAHLHDPHKQYDELRIAVAKELVARLAQLHQLDWQTLGFGRFMTVPTGPRAVSLEILDELYDDYKAHRVEPQPALVEALLSLRDFPPEAPARITLVKENCGLGDEVWEATGAKIKAMCDWESSRLGDPAADIATAMRSTGWCWTLSGILDHYEALTGERISEARVRYYAALFQIGEFAVLQGRALSYLNNNVDRRVQLMSIAHFPLLTMPGLAGIAGF
jgi:aminoglycoside phosphotransferase (APT) family kinase protein